MSVLSTHRSFLKICACVLALLCVTVGTGRAAPAEIDRRVQGAKPVGVASFTLFGAELYQAALYTPSGRQYRADQPYGLVLDYKRTIRGGTLISATLREMRRIEGRKSDHTTIEAKLNDCFATVGNGDRYSAIPRGADAVEFWRNGTLSCTLMHPDIRNRIMGIWLSDQSRDPQLSRQLRGQG